LMPMRNLIHKRKLSYYFKITSVNYNGSELVSQALSYCMSAPSSRYAQEIQSILRGIPNLDESAWKSSLNSKTKNDIILEISKKPSLQSLPLPKRWWRKLNYVRETKESSCLSMIRAGNANLGNRDSSMCNWGPSNAAGRVLICQLCAGAKLDESHVLLYCPSMQSYRASVKYSQSSYEEHVRPLKEKYTDPGMALRMLMKTCESRSYPQIHNLASVLQCMLGAYRTKWVELVEQRRSL